MREIKFKIKYQDREYNVYTKKPKRKDHRGWYLVHGYRRRLVSEHPFADKRGYVPEHRLIMEQHLARFLEPTEFVHHRDQDRVNNDISNLELQGSQSIHAKNHIDKIGKRNPHGQIVCSEPIFSELKFRLYNKNTKATRIYTLATLIGITFRRGQFEFRGRFTGLKDKNGKEIYEGDIVKWVEDCREEGTLDMVGKIYWRNKMAGFCVEGSYNCDCWICDTDQETIESIGNIYENKELLK